MTNVGSESHGETPSFEGHVDLVQVARALASAFGDRVPSGYLEGKTDLRDTLTTMCGCSELRAEELVDLLERYRFVEFDADPADPEGADEGHWYIYAL